MKFLYGHAESIMILLIDVGNTRIKAGFFQPGQAIRNPCVVTLLHDQIHRLPEQVRTLCRQHALGDRIAGALGVSVASETVGHHLDEHLKNAFDIQARWLDGATPVPGMVNHYDNPARLGADRWLAMVGIAGLAGDEPVLLATFGTATTVDALSKQGETHHFLGGLILPGPDLMRHALTSGTARLPHADITLAAFPCHTHQAIATGIAAAQAGAVCRQYSALFRQTGRPPVVLCSGGGWPAVEAEIQASLLDRQRELRLPQREARWIEAPVLDGLARVASSAQHDTLR